MFNIHLALQSTPTQRVFVDMEPVNNVHQTQEEILVRQKEKLFQKRSKKHK